MKDFIYYNPTRVIFQKGAEMNIGEYVIPYSKNILLCHDGVILKTGLYDKVMTSLKSYDIKVTELGDITPNPKLSTVYKGIDICNKNSIDFILAVGGASVIDAAKAIGIGGMYNGDVADIIYGDVVPTESIPVATIITLAGSGTEVTNDAVITRDCDLKKRDCYYDCMFPVFSILNPELCFTLPKYQTACGIADIFSHLLERFFTSYKYAEITDNLLVGCMKTILKYGPMVLKEPLEYEYRAQILWTGTVASIGILDSGREGDWACHYISYPVTSLYHVSHGAALAIVTPAWMKYVYSYNKDRFVKFAVDVLGISYDPDYKENMIMMAIEKLQDFFESLGLPQSLSQLDIDDSKFAEMAAKALENGYNSDDTIGDFVRLKKEDLIKIYKLAL